MITLALEVRYVFSLSFFSNKRWQIIRIQETPEVCDVKKVVSEIRSYEKTSCFLEVSRSEDPCEKEILKGVR